MSALGGHIECYVTEPTARHVTVPLATTPRGAVRRYDVAAVTWPVSARAAGAGGRDWHEMGSTETVDLRKAHLKTDHRTFPVRRVGSEARCAASQAAARVIGARGVGGGPRHWLSCLARAGGSSDAAVRISCLSRCLEPLKAAWSSTFPAAVPRSPRSPLLVPALPPSLAPRCITC